MYTVGTSEFDMIRVVYSNALINKECSVIFKIKSIEYGTPVDEATLFKDYDESKRVIKEIRKNINEIDIRNHYVCCDIIDKGNKIDYGEYLKELKIYILKPVLVEMR